jgi:hypothetical protein
MLTGLFYLAYKLLFWQNFTLGLAPLVIGMFFFVSIQLFFIGMLGEYIGAIHTLVQKRPLVLESERINFEYAPGEPVAELGVAVQELAKLTTAVKGAAETNGATPDNRYSHA